VLFDVLIAVAAAAAGAVASVAGFGIGSILTPLFALRLDTKLAVAAVSIPHLLATLLRFWYLRRHLDFKVFVNFGILSAAGGLTGALLHSLASSPLLAGVFAALLLFAGISALAGWTGKMRLGRRAAWIAGAVSGTLGGMVGNQGGIRSAALLGFGLDQQAFVATATAVGLVVDAARIPFYVAGSALEMLNAWRLIAVAVAGVLAGTIFGQPILRRIPQTTFLRVLGALLLALGLFMLFQAAGRSTEPRPKEAAVRAVVAQPRPYSALASQ
jgi:uncharacterized membrane protein YfcA